jgi:hypothetical protein
MIVALTTMTAGLASAQTAYVLPETSQATTLTAAVSEQAQIAVPSAVNFAVTDILSNKAATAAEVTVTNIVLATETKQLRISLRANAASFTPSVTSATTWSASDVSWAAATFSNLGVSPGGTLSSAADTIVVTCAADAASCSTTDLVFTLAAKGAVKRSGNHTLGMTWKFEAIGT